MNSRLEQYVEEIGAKLHAIPTDEREKEITEIRQHLEAIIAVRAEMGESEEEATLAALHQFGAAGQVGREVSRASLRGRLPSLREIGKVALFIWSTSLLIAAVDFVTFRPLYRAALERSAASPLSPYMYLTIVLGLLSLLILCSRLGVSGLLREMRSISTPWGAAVRLSVLCWLAERPSLIIAAAYLHRHPTAGAVWIPIHGIVTLLVALQIARIAPDGAYRGVVIAAILGAVIQFVLELGMVASYWYQYRLLVSSNLQFIPTSISSALGGYVLWAAVPAAGAVLGRRWRLRTA